MIIDKLNEILNAADISTTMYVFCAYIKSHIHEIPYMSIEEVARNCYASKGQISKCAKNLGFSSYIAFKDACIDYSRSLFVKPVFFLRDLDLPQNTQLFSNYLSRTIINVEQHLNYSDLSHLINDILKNKTVYLYAQGDNRSLCNVIQVELSALYIPVVICDTDFIKEYNFTKSNLLIILSTNGTIFYLDRKIISRVVKANVETWLITCNKNTRFSKNVLVVPSDKQKYNKYAIRHIVDIIIASIQLLAKERKIQKYNP